jgi:hypothetical protein
VNYEEATKVLSEPWNEWKEAQERSRAAHKAYLDAVRQVPVQICQRCEKPMPDYDHSNECDGCHLDWGWATPQACRDRRAAELDAEIERLKKVRGALI